MRDLLTTMSSMIIILFCLSLLFVGGENETDADQKVNRIHQNAGDLRGSQSVNDSLVFHRVQSVKLEEGILRFVTFKDEKIKEHYFPIGDKNVVFSRESDSDMPLHSIKFVDRGRNTLVLTIPPSLEIDMMELLLSK